jgi:hypothetical protein
VNETAKEVDMRYFYLAPEEALNSIYSEGIKADEKGEIRIISLKDDFLMDKFIFDVYAYEVLNLDVYCLFQVLDIGIGGELSDSDIDHIFSDTFKILKQETIEKKYIAPYSSEAKYEGMGLEEGVLPVENKDKFTAEYKQKIQEYLHALDSE